MTGPEQDPQEWLAKIRADMDQAQEGLKDISKLVSTFYKELVSDGVPGEHATVVVTNWMTTLMTLNHMSDEEEK